MINRPFRSTYVLLLIVAFALIVAACSSSDDGAQDTASTTTSTEPSSTSPTENTTSSSVPAADDTGDNGSGLALATVQGWTAVSLGSGVKPAIAIDPSNAVGMTWLLEMIGEGFVAYASSAADWEVETVKEGYFYGPIGLAYQPDGTPNVIIHDHQSDSFDPELGDLVRLVRDGSGWSEDIARDPGHDGWDATVSIGTDGVVHAAGVDPAQFGRTDGVEYYRNDGSGWQVTQIGSGPISYQYNVALALDSSNSPGLTYYNDIEGDLIFGSLVDGSWSLETAADAGDVGKYSSLAFDAQDQPTVSFFRQMSATSGEIVFATRVDGTWQEETIGEITAFSEVNARRNSSLAYDSQGRANVAFSDTSGVWFAVRDDSGWDVQQIVEAVLPLGQLVSLAIDANDVPHLAIYEVTQQQPLDGIVAYLTKN